MPVPQFTILAHNCWCQSCFMSARDQLGYKAGVVCGHLHRRVGWECVYCGKPVFRHTHMAAAMLQSVVSWLGWVAWDLKVNYQLWRAR